MRSVHSSVHTECGCHGRKFRWAHRSEAQTGMKKQNKERKKKFLTDPSNWLRQRARRDSWTRGSEQCYLLLYICVMMAEKRLQISYSIRQTLPDTAENHRNNILLSNDTFSVPKLVFVCIYLISSVAHWCDGGDGAVCVGKMLYVIRNAVLCVSAEYECVCVCVCWALLLFVKRNRLIISRELSFKADNPY